MNKYNSVKMRLMSSRVCFLLIFFVTKCSSSINSDEYINNVPTDYKKDAVTMPFRHLLENPTTKESYNLGYVKNSNSKMGFVNPMGFDEENKIVERQLMPSSTRGPLNVSNLYFQGLENYEQNAVVSVESQYPWLGRMVHSRTASYPLLCTVSCIQPRIFLAAARSVYAIKIKYSTVIYQQSKLPVKAILLPSNPTKQFFEDVALIVVEPEVFTEPWATVSFYSGPRTDAAYMWFENIIKGQQYKVVGYAIPEARKTAQGAFTEFRLVELPVVVDINICQEVYSKGMHTGFYVPCYNSCPISEFRKDPKSDMTRSADCKRYLGTEGGAVLNVNTNELLGVATWGVVQGASNQLPVGFAVPNLEAFRQDLTCAQLIRDDTSEAYKGYYQSLCDGIL